MDSDTVAPTILTYARRTSSRSEGPFGARDHRAISLAAHLEPPGLSPIASRVPYLVPWSSVKLRFIHGELPASEALAALDCSVVALCCLADSAALPAVSFGPIPRAQCVGLGFVRAVDSERRVFHIVTSVSVALLLTVNLLVRSANIDLPPGLFSSGPYVSFDVASGQGSGPRRARHNLVRQYGM